MTAADVLVRCLENEGVRYVFGIPGEENLEIVKALRESEKIRFIVTRHEQGAAFMADLVGRLTGKAGVCLSTLGPGATNLVTGVADANSDGAPLIAITGQVSSEKMHLTSHQYLDLTSMFEPITKRSKQIIRPDTVNEIVAIAFKYAESEKPGACYIDLPCDVAGMEVEEGLGTMMLQKPVSLPEIPDDASIDHAANAITQARRPVILCGHSAIRNHAAKALRHFARKLKIPVVTTMMAKGALPWTDPYMISTIGVPGRDYADAVMEAADLVIAVGYDIVELAPERWNRSDTHRIVHIDERAPHINKSYQPSVTVIGDISVSLDKISMIAERREEPKWAFGLRQVMLEEEKKALEDDSFPMKPQRVLADIRKAMDSEDDILISDVGAHKMWIARDYPCYRPLTSIISNGFATMGIAVPGAFAAKLLYPDRKVIAVTGDGGFMMNNQELETAVRYGISFVTLIFHDDNYGLIKWKQENRYGESYDVSFGNPDFVMMAESFGCKGYRVTKAEELLPILTEAFSQKAPSVIDCPVDYFENARLGKVTYRASELCGN